MAGIGAQCDNNQIFDDTDSDNMLGGMVLSSILLSLYNSGQKEFLFHLNFFSFGTVENQTATLWILYGHPARNAGFSFELHSTITFTMI